MDTVTKLENLVDDMKAVKNEITSMTIKSKKIGVQNAKFIQTTLNRAISVINAQQKMAKTAKEMEETDRLMQKASDAYDNTPAGAAITDGDTILKDIMDEADWEIGGLFEEIRDIYDASSDKQAVASLFYTLSGMEFKDYLQKCIDDTTKEEEKEEDLDL